MAGESWLRRNAFIVAAVLLPVVVVGLFLIASAIPRWRVPDPQFDLLFSVDQGYDPSGPRVTTSFVVREGRVEADLRVAAPNTYPTRTSLYLFDHATGEVRDVPLDPPRTLPEGDAVLTVGIPALTGRRVIPGASAPDGYEFEVRSSSAPGIVGELFGMRRYGQDVVLHNRGRVVRLTVPGGSPYATRAIGWLGADGGR